VTATLEGGEQSAACLGRTLAQGKTQYLFYRRLGGPHGQSGWAENLIPTSQQGHYIFLFSAMSRPTLGPNHPLSERVPGFFPRIKQPGCAVDCSSPSSVEVKNEWSYTSSVGWEQ